MSGARKEWQKSWGKARIGSGERRAARGKGMTVTKKTARVVLVDRTASVLLWGDPDLQSPPVRKCYRVATGLGLKHVMVKGMTERNGSAVF
jgi:hypothetical protein